MKIQAIECIGIALPLKRPFETSFGVTSVRDVWVVRLLTDMGWGLGEAPVLGPGYSYETMETALHAIRDLIGPQLKGRELSSVEDFMETTRGIRGHNMAKAAVEMALWDTWARSRGEPLYKMLGGTQPSVACGVSIGLQPSILNLVHCVDSFLAEGWLRIKIKIRPGMDVALVEAVRRHFGDVPLMVDGNSAYTLADLSLFRELDQYGLLMIEQPLGHQDLYQHARLQAQLTTPICLDESIKGLEDVEAAVELGSCKVINIKHSRVGGLWESIRIHDYCQRRGIPVWCGSMLESGVGQAHNIALASLPNFTLPGDLAGSERYFTDDVVVPRLKMSGSGHIKLSESSGIGYELDWEAVARYTTGRHVIRLA